MAAVDQDRELHRPRPAEVVQRVERGAYRAARVQHVIDQDDRLAVYAARRKVGAAQCAGACGPSASCARRRSRATPASSNCSRPAAGSCATR